MKEPARILFTLPNFDTAGSGRALLNIVERLDRRRFAPTVCVLRRGGRLEAEIMRMGVPYLDAPFAVSARPRSTLAFRARKAARAFRPHRFELWHSFHYLDDYTEPLIARLAGARSWIYTKKNMGWNRSWYLRTLLATRVAAQNTDMLLRFFARPRFRRKVVLVPRGVDVERFRPETPARLGLREKLGVPPGVIVVGCVAQILPVKGHPTLIDAIADVPEVRLWLAGRELDKSYAAGLRRQIETLGLQHRVSFLGEVQDVPALLAELDVFVLPTWGEWRMEGCPVALLEAISAGLPCIATDIPGSRDILENGKNGLLAIAGDAADLARAIRTLTSLPGLRLELGSQARRCAVDRYPIDREVRDYERLYESALFGKPDDGASVATSNPVISGNPS